MLLHTTKNKDVKYFAVLAFYPSKQDPLIYELNRFKTLITKDIKTAAKWNAKMGCANSVTLEANSLDELKIAMENTKANFRNKSWVANYILNYL